ncbi:MAG: acyltransferase [Akkermansia sp.]|nr:acyltransferase [Akkermansia sp.]
MSHPSQLSRNNTNRNVSHDVMRGLAILLIIIFHANKELLPYGYHGVDIFLAICGYYICQSFRRETYSTSAYLKKRLARIYPPLLISILLTLLLLTIFSSKDTLIPSAKTALAAIFGVSNIYLSNQEGGYFANSTMDNALLHTWYIAITLQVYILFALVRHLLSRCRTIWKLIPAALTGILSFLWANQVLIFVIFHKLNLPFFASTPQAPDEMYYELFPRLWVVLAGCGAAFIPETKSTKMATFLGLAGIVLMLVPSVIHTETAKILAVCVVTGSVLAIRYLPESRNLTWLTESKPLAWVGRISFSLYLVHLPIFTLYRSLTGQEELPLLDICLILPLLLLLGYAFYKGVENRRIPGKLILPAAAACLIFAPAAICTRGFSQYIHKKANSISIATYTDFGESKDEALLHDYPGDQLTYWDGVYRFTGQKVPQMNTTLLHIGDSEKAANFILLGDCQAHTLYAGLHECCRQEGLSGVFPATYMLAFWDRLCNGGDNRVYHREKAEAMLKWLSRHPEIKHVILAQLWSYWMPPETLLEKKWDGSLHSANNLESATQDLMTLCRKLKDTGKNVIILNEIPTIASHSPLRAIRGQLCFSDSPTSKTLQQSAEEYARKNAPYLHCLEKVQAAGLCTLLHAAQIHLEDGQFSAWEDGQVLMHDNMHQSYPAALKTAKGLMPKLREILKQ